MKSGKKGQIALLVLFVAIPISWLCPTIFSKIIVCVSLVVGSGILACVDMEGQYKRDKRSPSKIVKDQL